MEENIHVIKSTLITIGKSLIVGLAILFIISKFGGCDNSVITPKHDNIQYFEKMKSDSVLISKLTIKQKEDSLKVIVSKHSEDSLKVIADKYTGLYKGSAKKVRELIALGICDTVEVKVALNDCDSVIKSKDNLISQKDSTYDKVQEELITVKEELTISKSMVVTAQTIIKNQEEDYKLLEKDSKKALRKQKAKTIGVIILASIAEVLTIFGLK